MELTKINENAELFPLYGVILGKTTVEELTKMGTVGRIDDDTGKPYSYYEIKGMDFWYNDGIADEMYISRSHPLPAQWKQMGFDWSLSYNNWIKLLEHIGFMVEIVEPPHVEHYDGHDSFFANIIATRQKWMDLEIELGFRYSTNTTVDSPSTLYLIEMKSYGFLTKETMDHGQNIIEKNWEYNEDLPQELIKNSRAEEIKDGSDEEIIPDEYDLFPLYGVTLGKTTTKELSRLGSHTKSKKDNGEVYSFYVVDGMKFWYDHDGTSDHMYITKTDPLPDQWREFGFDWNLSYDHWIRLLEDQGYHIEIADPPHSEPYDGHDSFKAKLVATRQTNMLLELTLGFFYGRATTSDSPRTLYNMRIKCRGFLTPAPYDPVHVSELIEGDMENGDMEKTSPGNKLFPLYGVSLGKTTVEQLSRLGVKSRNKDQNGIPYKHYVVHGIEFWYDENGIADHIYLTHTGLLPHKWRDLGFDWEHSFDEWVSLLEHLEYRIDITEPPHVIEYNGHDSFAATVIATGRTPIPLEIDLHFKYSRGTRSDSMGTIYSLALHVAN